MGIYREWPERPKLTALVISPATWTEIQRDEDREHYAQVEKNHAIALEAALSDSDYFKKEAKANALRLNEARAEIEKLKAGNKSLADAATAYRDERNEARKEAAEEKNFRVAFRAEAVTFRNERDEARAAYKSLVVTSVNASMCDDLVNQRDEARAERDYFKTCLDGANAVNSAARFADAINPTLKRPTGRLESIEARVSKLESRSNAKQADEVLDSLRFAR